MTQLYPLLLEPMLKPGPPAGPTGEAWVLGDHPDGGNRVLNGPLAGRSLAQVRLHYGALLLGPGGRIGPAEGRFPLRIRLVDANDGRSARIEAGGACAEILLESGYGVGERPLTMAVNAGYIPQRAERFPKNLWQRLEFNRWFEIERCAGTGVWLNHTRAASFHALLVCQGEGKIGWAAGIERVRPGVCILVPAGLGTYELSGRMNLLRCRVA